jgi:hypothetical protein
MVLSQGSNMVRIMDHRRPHSRGVSISVPSADRDRDEAKSRPVAGSGTGGGISPSRLRRAGWSCGEEVFTYPDGRYVHEVDATDGAQRIVGRGGTPAEAWHRAIEAAAGCGMLKDGA